MSPRAIARMDQLSSSAFMVDEGHACRTSEALDEASGCGATNRPYTPSRASAFI
jgi:hypothetical protein